MQKICFILIILLLAPSTLFAQEERSMEPDDQQRLFVHLKTSLNQDDSQVCVAYNIIWAALREGLAVDVVVDADGINTFKQGVFSSEDSIQAYKIPESLRQGIGKQLSLPLSEVPKTYGDYLIRLHKEGARFYINKGFLIVAGIADDPDNDMGKIAPYAAKIFIPVTFTEMLELRRRADFDYSY
jgi:hypothetical protein